MSAAVLVLQLLATSPAFEAHAPANLPAVDQPDPAAPVWYGWQPFLADATAACLMSGILWTQSQPGREVATTLLVMGGVGIYLFGAPSLHLARGRPQVALLDVAMRVGLPLGGLVAGGLLAVVTQQPGVVAPGFGVGIFAAIGIDILDLSWERPEPASEESAASAPVRWAPFAGMVRGAPVAGLAAVF
jgi:hypothetical protein